MHQVFVNAGADLGVTALGWIAPGLISHRHRSFIVQSHWVAMLCRILSERVEGAVSVDEDVIQRQLQRLEHRYRRAQTSLAAARADYAALTQLESASQLQVHQASTRVERAQRALSELLRDMDHWEYNAI